MTSLRKLVTAIGLTTALAFAQGQAERKDQKKDQPATQRSTPQSPQADRATPSTTAGMQSWTGTIVDANCSHATMSSTSPGSTSPSAQSTSPGAQRPQTGATPGTQADRPGGTSATGRSGSAHAKEILKNCRITDNTTSFAIVTNDGTFAKLDATGNSKVLAELEPPGATPGKKARNTNLRVNVTGNMTGDTITVQNVTKAGAGSESKK